MLRARFSTPDSASKEGSVQAHRTLGADFHRLQRVNLEKVFNQEAVRPTKGGWVRKPARYSGGSTKTGLVSQQDFKKAVRPPKIEVPKDLFGGVS